MKNNEFITTTALQTQKLGMLLAKELEGGEIICLSGDLGAGKTTFTQGLLKGLRISGPYTSPTFAIMKHYRPKAQNLKPETSKKELRVMSYGLRDVYHIDAYRIGSDDLVGLGWQDFAGQANTVTIVEWPENVKRIIPRGALWLDFQWVDEKQRRITISEKK